MKGIYYLTLLSIFLLLPHYSSAQVFFTFGYGGGYWMNGLANLESFAYRFNNTNDYGEYQQKMNVHPYFHGLHLSFGWAARDWGGVEWNWTNRHKQFHGRSDSIDFHFKTRLNTFGWGSMAIWATV